MPSDRSSLQALKNLISEVDLILETTAITDLTDQTCYPNGGATAEFGGDAPLACLHTENPHRLVTLWDMLRFNAHHFVGVATNIGQMMMDLRVDRIPTARSAKAVDEGVELLRLQCLQLGLDLSAEHAKRIDAHGAILKATSTNDKHPLNQLESGLREFQQRIWDELNLRIFLQIPVD